LVWPTNIRGHSIPILYSIGKPNISPKAFATKYALLAIPLFCFPYSERQTLLRQNQLNEDQLKKANKECLNLVEQLLVKVDWVKVAGYGI